MPTIALFGRSAYAKVSFPPLGAYVDAKFEQPDDESDEWRVLVNDVPKRPSCGGAQCQMRAVLHVTRGEHGKVVGTADMGLAD